MIEDVKDWVRARTGKVLVCFTGLLLTTAVVMMGLTLTSDQNADAENQAGGLIARLQNDLDASQDELRAKHTKLLAELPGLDIERVGRDRATGRGVLLSLTGSSATTRTVRQTQVLLDARYSFLDHKSRVLTEFVPEWMAATGVTQGSGTVYQLADLDITLTGVQSLDYSYVGVARLDPVGKPAKSELVVFTYTTAQDGTVSSLDAYRVSSRTRDELIK